MKINLRRDQRGLGAVVIVLGLVLVLTIAGGAYYVIGKNKDKDGTGGGTATNKVAQSECEKYYDDKDFCRFASTWSYGGEQKVTITSPDGVSVMETDAQGNTRVTTEGGGQSAAFITIGKTSYMKDSDSENWLKFTSDTPDTSINPTEDLDVDFDFEEEAAKDTSKITKEGKEACGSLTCFKYTMTDSATPGETSTLWFDDKDYKLRRMSYTNAEGTVDMVFEYSVAAITEPSPVVDMPTFGN